MDEADRTTVKDATHKVVLYLQLGALITGALAVAVAAIFGVRAEKEKNLGLHYLSLRPLISIYTKSSETLQIKYENAVVKQPGLLSARLENIGKLPIEARDIDKALSLTFSDAKILSVEITNKNPSDIEVLTQHTQQVAQISHKLLNVGDSIRV